MIITIFYIVFISYSYASSPHFVRQDILDNSSDMIIAPTFNINKNNTINEKIATNLTLCTTFDYLTNSSLSPYGDITEVSYLSDGKFFNTTLWIYDYVNFTKPLFPEGIDILQLPNDKNLSVNDLAKEYVNNKINSFNIINPIFLTKKS
jgi:hypothetical protein